MFENMFWCGIVWNCVDIFLVSINSLSLYHGKEY
jgi:hypothetical protein